MDPSTCSWSGEGYVSTQPRWSDCPTNAQDPCWSNNVAVPAPLRQDAVVTTKITPTISFVVISDRVGTLSPAEEIYVRGTRRQSVNRALTCTGGVETSGRPPTFFGGVGEVDRTDAILYVNLASTGNRGVDLIGQSAPAATDIGLEDKPGSGRPREEILLGPPPTEGEPGELGGSHSLLEAGYALKFADTQRRAADLEDHRIPSLVARLTADPSQHIGGQREETCIAGRPDVWQSYSRIGCFAHDDFGRRDRQLSMIEPGR
ncbi:hypothetical protein PTTG_27987 [Puccinia triticina 1-1 BBBD Race 1]|uniref:Uncharacterized protein n=1 Tax=Puccinia triticina (isolate 1-1 / race 1 (BBBD)) TaxID=630390 RepID=A0A180GFC7_PUCT1|nr:hypothetical protein PTTG_27987 [Puccinia triticina 1-1 BBBD Race 1]